MAIRNCSQIWGSPIKKPEKQALKVSYVLNWPIPKVPILAYSQLCNELQAQFQSGHGCIWEKYYPYIKKPEKLRNLSIYCMWNSFHNKIILITVVLLRPSSFCFYLKFVHSLSSALLDMKLFLIFEKSSNFPKWFQGIHSWPWSDHCVPSTAGEALASAMAPAHDAPLIAEYSIFLSLRSYKILTSLKGPENIPAPDGHAGGQSASKLKIQSILASILPETKSARPEMKSARTEW